MVELTGKKFMCPYYKADMIDVVWWMIAKQTKLAHYLGDVLIKHLHSTSMKEAFDVTFQRLRPLQISANSSEMQQVCRTYATMIAGNLIAAGVGEWCPI
jgi:hypothetical protein